MQQNHRYFLFSILLLHCVTNCGETAMRMFKQETLYRDKMVEFLEQKCGSRIHWCLLGDADFDREIRSKLLSETEEVVAAKDRNTLIGELADVYEVIDALTALHNISKEEIIASQTKKRDERGGFMGRKFVTVAEHPVGSFGEKYCLADPEKYPEIIK